MVGMTQLDSGNIHLKAQKKNNVGYMPQVRHGIIGTTLANIPLSLTFQLNI